MARTPRGPLELRFEILAGVLVVTTPHEIVTVSRPDMVELEELLFAAVHGLPAGSVVLRLGANNPAELRLVKPNDPV